MGVEKFSGGLRNFGGVEKFFFLGGGEEFSGGLRNFRRGREILGGGG